MFDPTVLYAAIIVLLAIVAVQGVRLFRSRSAHEATLAEHKAASTKLAVAASQAILAIIKSGSEHMRRLQVKTVGATLAEIVKLERQTGERIADMTDDRFAEVMLGTSPSFTRGKGFTMRGASDPSWQSRTRQGVPVHRIGDGTMEDFLRSLGMPGGPTRQEAKADVLRRGYSGDPLAELLGRPGVQTIMWSPGDPIPKDAPPEIQELLRSFNDASNDGGTSLDALRRAAEPRPGARYDDGRSFHVGETKDAGSAEPLADPPGSGTGGQPNGRESFRNADSPTGFGSRPRQHAAEMPDDGSRPLG